MTWKSWRFSFFISDSSRLLLGLLRMRDVHIAAMQCKSERAEKGERLPHLIVQHLCLHAYVQTHGPSLALYSVGGSGRGRPAGPHQSHSHSHWLSHTDSLSVSASSAQNRISIRSISIHPAIIPIRPPAPPCQCSSRPVSLELPCSSARSASEPPFMGTDQPVAILCT